MDPTRIARSLDRTGKSITTFIVFDVVAELEELEIGDRLELLTDDLEPIERDLIAWCDTTTHELIDSQLVPQGRRFIIKKGPLKPHDTTLAMVISADGMEELLSPMGFALGAALEGIDVHLFFQGPAVRVLTRGFRPKLTGWARPFSRFAASGMAKTGHIAAQDKLRQARSLGAQIYVCGPSMDHFKVRQGELIFPDIAIVEYLSFMSVMKDADIHLYI